MLIALIIVVCIVLLILGFLVPRLSTKPQRGVDATLSTGARTAGKAPGPIGRWLRKPFSTSQRAADTSASAGRRSRGKMPL
jgi:uncharacterized protein DUF6411